MGNLSVQEVRALALRLAARQAVDSLQGVRPSCDGVVLLLRDYVLGLADQQPGPDGGWGASALHRSCIEGFLFNVKQEPGRDVIADSAEAVVVADWLVSECSGLECSCEPDGDAENGPDPHWGPCWACSLADALDCHAASLAGSKFAEVI